MEDFKMRKKILEGKLARLSAKKEDLAKRCDAAVDVAEVRSLTRELEDVNAEIAETKAELEAIEAESRSVVVEDEVPAGATLVNGNVVGSFKARSAEDMDSMEYRNAFKDYVLKNRPIPAELRGNANTLTSDVASVIPTVIINRIVEKITACGMILPLVTRTAYAAGVVVPTSATKPVASWVNEGASSDKQKKTTGSITFSHFKLRCEISMSMEVGTMALDVFESTFVKNVADAMVVALEKAILAGTGSGQPTGILNGTLTSYEVTSVAVGKVSYADLVACEAKLPVEYEGTAKWFMTKAQFMAFVGMVDSDGQPIARVNQGIGGKPERTLLGREVVIHPYATEMGSYVAGIYNFSDYVLNTIYDMGIQRKQDWDTEDYLTKAVMGVDGKPVDKDSLVLLKLKISG
jgi:HK97 family phage major capsid protein